MAIAGLCNFLNLYTPQSILPTLADAFGVAPGRTGLTVTAPLIAVAVVAPFVGTISDMLGRKRLIVTALSILVIPTLLTAAAQSFAALLLWRFIQGLLLPFIFAVAIGYIGDECPGATGVRAAGNYALGTILGGFGGRFIAGVAAQLAGWRSAFVLIAALTAAGALCIAVVLPRERNFRPLRGGVRGTLTAYAGHLRSARLLATFAVGFGMLFCNVAVFTFVNFYLAAPPYSLTSAELGFVFVVYLVGVATTPVSTALVIRIGRRATVGLAILLSIAGLALTLLHGLAAVIAGLAVMCGGLFVVQTLSLGYIAATVRRAVSTAVGLYVTMFYIGGALGGIAPGPVWQRYGWPGIVGLLIATLVGMLALAALYWNEGAMQEGSS